ncbi:Poly(rC)-binding protein 3 [Coemansia sp. RSA 1200]|nr:Poly(rC)-binding protein 3 [Coemansia sp. RSA 1200]
MSACSIASRPSTPGTPATARRSQAVSTYQQKERQEKVESLTARLVFHSKDGGMLIGKDGRHINMLKESTAASWSITGSTAEHEDRIVAISGPTSSVVDAVHLLAEHIDKQQQQQQRYPDRHKSSEPNPLVLRFLFPLKCIGAILGVGGSRASKLRADPGITRFHVFGETIPFTQERIVEIGGSTSALKTATLLMLKSTESMLTYTQKHSTLYQPVKNGLHQMIARDSGHADDVFSPRTEKCRVGSKHVHPQRTAVESHGRNGGSKKRSRSLVKTDGSRADDDGDDSSSNRSDKNTSSRRTSSGLSSDSRKRLRRMSDSCEYRRDSVHTHRSRRDSESSSRHTKSDLGRTSHISNPKTSKQRHFDGGSSHRSNNRSDCQRLAERAENKLVISDSIAGRLIGRNGSYLVSLQERSGARITLSPRVQDMPDRVVTVTGSHEQVDRANRLIKTSMRDFQLASQ